MTSPANGRLAIQIALQTGLLSLAAYLCGSNITGFFHSASAETGGMWAMMSAIVVLQQARNRPLDSAWGQILATLVGAFVGAIWLTTLPSGAVGMGVCIFVAVLLCHVLRIPGHASLAALAVGVVMVVTSLHPTLHPVLSAALRFTEACVGTAMATLAIRVWPGPAAQRPQP